MTEPDPLQPFDDALANAFADPVGALRRAEELVNDHRDGDRTRFAAALLVRVVARINALQLDGTLALAAEALEHIAHLPPRFQHLLFRVVAGTLAARGAVGMADRCLRTAWSRIGRLPEARRDRARSDLLSDRALVAAEAGDMVRFRNLATQAVETSDDTTPSRMPRLLHAAQACRLLGDGHTALEHLEQADASPGGAPVTAAFLSRVERVHVGMLLGHPPPLAACEALLQDPVALSSPSFLACAEAALADRIASVRPTDAAALATRAARGLRDGGVPLVGFRLLALAAELHERVGDLDLAIERERERYEAIQAHPYDPAAMHEDVRALADRAAASIDALTRRPAIRLSDAPTMQSIDLGLDTAIDQLLASAGRPDEAFTQRHAELEQRLDPGDLTRRARLALALAASRVNSDLTHLAVEPLAFTLAHLEALPYHTERLRALRGTSRLLGRARRPDDAFELLLIARRNAAETETRTERARALLSLGVIATTSDPEAAIDYYRQTLEVARERDDALREEIEPLTLAAIAFMQRTAGDARAAFKTIQEARASRGDGSDAFTFGQIEAERYCILAELGAPLDLDQIRRELAQWNRDGWHQQVGDAAMGLVLTLGRNDLEVGREFGDIGVRALEAAERWDDLGTLFAALIGMEERAHNTRQVFVWERRRADLEMREHAALGQLTLALDPLLVELEARAWLSGRSDG